MKSSWMILPFIIFLGFVGFLWRGLSLEPQTLPSVMVGRVLPTFTLKILGDDEKQFNTSILKGKISLLNVWASWCSACMDEHVFLLQLAREGIPIYGLNYKDNQKQALSWLAEWGNPYQAIAADSEGKVAIDLGVYGAPETFLIDQSGVIRYRYAGILTSAVWEKDFLPQIKNLREKSDG